MKKSKRLVLLEWAEQSRIDPARLPEAMRLSNVIPSSDDWRRFLDTLLLWLGALLTASGVVFFFAYNWDDLSRFTRFAMVEGLLVVALLAFWRLGLASITGKVTLMIAAVFVGVLLALVGQTYQTGADTFELFGVWCVLILPWAVISRFDVLWIFWLLLLNTAVILYYDTFGGIFGVLFGVEQMLWLLFGVNTSALMVWEWMVVRGRSSRRSVRWITRLLATVSGGLITALAILGIFGESEWISWLGPLLWLLWMVCAYYWYRNIDLDVYVLAIGVLSAVAVVNVVLGRLLFEGGLDETGGMFLMSLSVIGLSALGAVWLRKVVKEEQT